MGHQQRLAETIELQHAELVSLLRSAEAASADLAKAQNLAAQQATKQFEMRSQLAVSQAQADREKARQAAMSEIKAALQNAGSAVVSWSAPNWARHEPPKTGRPPSWLRVGELQSGQGTGLPSLPALAPLVGHRNLFVAFEEKLTRHGGHLLESIVWRIAALSPPCTYRLTLVDALDQGHNLASLLQLPESVRGPKIYSRDDEIEGALVQLAQDVEDVIQKKLLNTFSDVDAYNAANPSTAAPYRFLVLVGFPYGFTSKAADRLAIIARAGRRAGCYLLAGLQRGREAPHGFDMTAFLQNVTYITLKGPAQAEWNDPDLKSFILKPDVAPPAAAVAHLASVIQPLAQASATQTLSFQDYVERKAHWWEVASSSDLRVTVGLDERGQPYRLTIGAGLIQHALVGGTTASGKTNLLHLIILMLCTRYAPSELELYLVDFKEGVEFQDYAVHSLPHARAVVVEAEREFGLNIIVSIGVETPAFRQVCLQPV